MKILLQTTAPFCHTGYSVQGTLLAVKLLQNNHEVIWASNYGLNEASLTYSLKYRNKFYPIVVLPTGYQNHCQDIIDYYFKRFNCDIIITHCDVFVLRNYGERFPNKWIAIFPVDHQPVSRFVYHNLRGCWKPVSYSKFAIKELKKVGINATYLPFGVDSTIFKPINIENKKTTLGFNKRNFVFGIVAANLDYEDRKEFGSQLLAFKQFVKKYPNVRLFIHTNDIRLGMPCIPIRDYVKTLKLDEYVTVIDKWQCLIGLSQVEVNKIYNVIDCLMNCSSGEGFGVPLIESISAGTPVIATNFSSMPDIVEPGINGELVKTKDIHMTYYGSWRKKPDIDDIIRKMEIVYLNLKRNPDYYKEGCLKTAKKWDMEYVWKNYMKGFFGKIKKEFKHTKINLANNNIKQITYNTINDLLEVEKV